MGLTNQQYNHIMHEYLDDRINAEREADERKAYVLSNGNLVWLADAPTVVK